MLIVSWSWVSVQSLISNWVLLLLIRYLEVGFIESELVFCFCNSSKQKSIFGMFLNFFEFDKTIRCKPWVDIKIAGAGEGCAHTDDFILAIWLIKHSFLQVNNYWIIPVLSSFEYFQKEISRCVFRNFALRIKVAFKYFVVCVSWKFYLEHLIKNRILYFFNLFYH